MNKKNKKIKEDTSNLLELSKRRVILQFRDVEGSLLDSKIDISLNTSKEALGTVLKEMLKKEDDSFSFFYKNYEIQKNISELLVEFSEKLISSEETLVLDYIPESIYDIRPVTRISSSLEGHKDAVLEVVFSPDNKLLASCSGDKTIRLWDPQTETPIVVLEEHSNWVLGISFAPNAKYLASFDNNGDLILWNLNDILSNKENFLKAQKNKKLEEKGFLKKVKAHGKFITSVTWKPLHLWKSVLEFQLVTSSKDGTLKIWQGIGLQQVKVLSMHTSSVTKVLWTGSNKIISSSQDRNLIVWSENQESSTKLESHAHWVNCMSLNSHHILRAGPFSDLFSSKNNSDNNSTESNLFSKAQNNYNLFIKTAKREYCVSGSDDHTLMLHDLSNINKKGIKKCTGHIAPVNQVQFSPNGIFFVSASFDKTLRIWSIINDGCIGVLRGHVADVYVLAFSKDSKWVVSGSKDSTIQVWNVKMKKRAFQLPGHADEVYSVDWSPDGLRMASGGKDKMVRIWKN